MSNVEIVSSKLRRTSQCFWHWCPGCDAPHALFFDHGWTFNGNLDKPTFTPSFGHNLGRKDACHIIVTDGVLNFQSDCWHELSGKSVPLIDWPPEHAMWGLSTDAPQ